jgi:predicted dehydrogenase
MNAVINAGPVLRVGIIGYGVMGKAHSYGYRVAPMLRRLPVTPVVTVMSGRHASAVAAAGAAWGVPATVTDWHELIARDDVDMVDICTPPGTHAQMAQQAAAAGKAVLCEKPLALNYPEASAALAAVTEAGVHNAVGFNYRRLPAVALMQRMIAEGAIGELRLWRASWLSDEFADPATPYDWRFDRAMGGTTIADLGCHLIDMALTMVGPVESTCAQATTFIGSRSGGTVTVEANGSRGTLMFDYARLNELWYASADDDVRLYGMRRIRAEHPSHPYAAQWWPIGQGVGYGASFANQVADLLEGWPEAPWTPGFREGAAVQAVCDAMETSAAYGRWVTINEVTSDVRKPNGRP